MSKGLITLITVLMMILAACETGDTATDALSAQNQQPALTAYETTDLDIAADALFAAAGGSAVATGNAPMALAIQRADALLQCLQDTGAISGLMYVEENPGVIPQIGASLVVNKSRVESNIFSCLTDLGFGAQSALEIEPCIAYGEFTVQSDEFWFAYVGVGSGLCAGFSSHYTSLNATFIEQLP